LYGKKIIIFDSHLVLLVFTAAIFLYWTVVIDRLLLRLIIIFSFNLCVCVITLAMLFARSRFIVKLTAWIFTCLLFVLLC
jgi:hypothetical protein